MNYFDVDPVKWEAKQQAKRLRYSRVADAALRIRRTYAAIQMRNGEGLGTAIDRLEQTARRFGRNELADRLLEILQYCGCDRQVAIANLNAQHVADAAKV